MADSSGSALGLCLLCPSIAGGATCREAPLRSSYAPVRRLTGGTLIREGISVIKPNTVSSQALFATTQIVTIGSDESEASGTAFFFHFKLDDQRQVPVLITNKHVIKGASKGIFHVHEATTDATGTHVP